MVPFTHGILTGLFTIPSPSFVTFLKNSKLSFWYWSILEFFSNIFRQKKTPNNFKPNGSYGCSKIAVQKWNSTESYWKFRFDTSRPLNARLWCKFLPLIGTKINQTVYNSWGYQREFFVGVPESNFSTKLDRIAALKILPGWINVALPVDGDIS